MAAPNGSRSPSAVTLVSLIFLAPAWGAHVPLAPWLAPDPRR